MIGNFIGWLLTVGLMIGLIVALILLTSLSTYEDKVKKTKYKEFESKHRWWSEARTEFEKWEEQYDRERNKYWCAAIVFILVVAIASAGILTYADYQFEKTPWTETNYVTHKIINIADNSEIAGRISGTRRHASGYIGEITVYQYYYVTARGSWDLQKASEKITEFFPTDGEPCARWYRIEKEFWWNKETKYRCDIYIPEDAMITDFVIDME